MRVSHKVLISLLVSSFFVVSVFARPFSLLPLAAAAKLLQEQSPTTATTDERDRGVAQYQRSDGRVQNIFVFRSLSHGLTEQTIKAARKIKFIAATKDGHPVSQAVMLEYYFNLY
jgi:hypothetical protein